MNVWFQRKKKLRLDKYLEKSHVRVRFEDYSSWPGILLPFEDYSSWPGILLPFEDYSSWPGILLFFEGLLFLAGNTSALGVFTLPGREFFCLRRGFPAENSRKPEIPEVLPVRKGLLGSYRIPGW
jgi:hypothetical protein